MAGEGAELPSFDPSGALLPESIQTDLAAATGALPTGSKQTAKRAVEILISKDVGFHEPSGRERDALLVAFALKRKAIHGAAFDLVRLSRQIDLTTPEEIAANMDALELFEVKSTNRHAVGSDFKGYFFALTTAELLVAQSLGDHFRFAFVNTVTGDHMELSLREVFSRARGIYPTWSIKF